MAVFTQKQLEIIKAVGQKGLSFQVAASELDMLKSEFMPMYKESRDAQLAYEKGLAELEKKVNTVAEKGMMEGDAKKFEHFAKNVLNLDAKNNVQEEKTSKKVELPKILFNPESLLEIDDDELARRMMEKSDDVAPEPVKKPAKKTSKAKEEDDGEI